MMASCVRVAELRVPSEHVVPLSELGQRLAGLRLRDARGLDAIRRSLERHGQLSALKVFADDGRFEVLDGFKRLHAGRVLGWTALAVEKSDIGLTEAKLQMVALHQRQGLTELEEGFIVRSLYRDDGLSQPDIARLLDRHKSWVCRRLLLVEALDPAVQAAVRLGLLAPRAAVALGALPRGNQPAVSAVVIQHGLTVRQTERLVAQILARPDEAAHAESIARRLVASDAAKGPSIRRAPRSAAEAIAADIATLHRVAARLEARLLATPLGALGMDAADIVVGALLSLSPVLAALAQTVETVTGKGAPV